MVTDLLTQEVIERLKVASKEPSRGERWAKVSYLDAATILAVLEAAREWAEAESAAMNAAPVTREMWKAVKAKRDALLALISVEVPE